MMRENKIYRLIASILIFVLIFIECATDIAYASPFNKFNAHILNSSNLATPNDADKEDDKRNDDIILDIEDDNIEVDGEDINVTEKEYTYGIQNTGTRDGVLGTRLILTCTGIDSSEIEVFAAIHLFDDTNEYESLTCTDILEVEGDEETFKYVYYLPTCDLDSTDRAGYKLKLIFSPSQDYKVAGLFSARLVGNLEVQDSELIFSEDIKDYSNTLHSDGTEEEGKNGLFSVRFRTNGGDEIETQKVLIGDCAIEPDVPERLGYMFKYWDYKGEPWDFNEPVTSHMTLNAVWEADLCTVIFEANNGEEESITQEVQYGRKILRVKDPVRSGYRFMGWYCGDEKWDFSNQVVTNEYIVDGCVTLEARWGEVTYYTVQFKDKEDDSLIYGTYKIESGLHVNRVPVPRRNGYSFSGWTVEADDSVWSAEKEITEDIILLANWTKVIKTYTVKFDLNGGESEDIETQTVNEGELAIEPDNPPVLQNYTFGGWYLGKKPYDFSQPVTKNITLKARWEGSYTVSFDLNGGIGDFETMIVDSGNAITEPTELPTKQGFKFKGWYWKDKRYVFSDPVYEDIKLVAEWMDEEAFEGRYAVSIYGIYTDVDSRGNILGLTFGPAMTNTGALYVSHEPEEEGAMCIHDMSWKEIVEQSRKDATVFQECMEHGCTKSVEFELKGDLSYPYQKMEYPDDSDGDGYIGLTDGYNKYTINNQQISKAYAASGIRTILSGKNGYTNRRATGVYALRRDASLVSMLPKDLTDYIIPKKYTYYSDVRFKTLKSLTDKLWLPSWNELSNPLFTNAGANDVRRYGEGVTYEKLERNLGNVTNMKLLNNTKISNATTWLRTPYRWYSGGANIQASDNRTTANVSPAFCLAGPSKGNIQYRIWFNTNTDDPTLSGQDDLESFKVGYNQKVSSVVESLPRLYRGNDYEFIGWYVADTEYELMFGKNISRYLPENRLTLNTRVKKPMNVYARWGRPGYLKSKELLRSCFNTNALYFKQSKKLTTQYKIVDISQMSDESLYTWYDPEDRTQYWWSSVNKMTVSETFAETFAYMSNWQKIDLTNITFPTVKSMYRVFRDCTGLQEVIFDENVVTRNVTDMREMFYNCKNLTYVNFGDVTAESVTSLNHMFTGASKIKRLNMGNFATPNVTQTISMFEGCTSLEYLDFSKFDTHKVTNTSYMFKNASNLKEVVYGDNFVDTALDSWGVQDLMWGTEDYYAPGSYHSQDYQDNPTYQMFWGCKANRPPLWSEGRWVEDLPDWGHKFIYKGTYIKGHNINVSFVNSSMVDYPISTVPNYVIPWGHTQKQENLPDLGVYESNGLTYKFLGWSEEPSGYYKKKYFGDAIYAETDKGYANEIFVTGDTELRYVKSGLKQCYAGDISRCWDYTELNHRVQDGGRNTGHYSYITLYPRWSCEGLAKDGHIINQYINENAVSFKRSEKEPTGNYTDISYTDDRSVRTWYESSTKTQYWWSTTGTMTLYSNAHDMFSGKSKLQSIDIRGIDFSRCQSMKSMFQNCSALVELITEELYDTANVKSMESMFAGCSSLETTDLSIWDASNVTTMKSMFNGDTCLINIDLNVLDTSSVRDMSYLFSGCTKLKDVQMDKINTSSVQNMAYMFNECHSLTYIQLDTLDTSSLIDVQYMFNNAKALNSIVLNNIDAQSITNMQYMFNGCSALSSISLRLNTSSATNMQYMFNGCSTLKDTDIKLNTANVINMSHMFTGCKSLERLDISSFDTHKVNNMQYMFNGCKELGNIVYSDTFVEDGLVYLDYITSSNTTYSMFTNCDANKPYTFEVGRWSKTSDSVPGTYIKNHKVYIRYSQSKPHQVQNIILPSVYTATWGYPIGEAAVPELVDTVEDCIFDGWNGQNEGYKLGLRFTKDSIIDDTSNARGYTYYENKGNYTNITFYTKWVNEGVAKKGVDIAQRMTSYRGEFRKSETLPDDMSNVQDISLCEDESVLTWWDNTSNTQYWWSKTGTMKPYKTTEWMFRSKNFIFIDLTDVDFSLVTDMSCMFKVGGEGINDDTIRIKFDDVPHTENVTNMSYMFSALQELRDVNIEVLDTSNVTDMSGMFYHCRSVSNLDLTSFDTSKVINMHRLFYWCLKLKNVNVSSFDTSNVTNMSYMFYHDTELEELDLSNFDTSKVTTMVGMFQYSDKLKEITYGDNFVTDSLYHKNYWYNSYGTTNNTADMFSSCPANKPANWTGRWYSNALYLEGYKVKITYAHAKNQVISGLTMPPMYEVDWGYPLGEVGVPELLDPNGQALFEGWNEESEGYTLNKSVDKDFLLNFTDNVGGTRRHGFGETSAYITLYAKWSNAGVAKQGSVINGKINNSALYFKQSDEEPAAGVQWVDISLSDDKSVKTWYDSETRTQYWWSSVGKMVVTNSASGMFNGKTNLKEIDLTNVDLSLVNAMDSFCNNCRNLEKITFDSQTKIPNTANMDYMFSSCAKLKELDLSSLTSKKITNVAYMFNGCTVLDNIIFSSELDSTGIPNTRYMFSGCRNLTSLDLSWLETSKLVYAEYMFANCINLQEIDYGTKFKEGPLGYLHQMRDWNTTYCMYQNCFANKPPLWTEGRWTDSDDSNMYGSYIRGHVVYVDYHSNIGVPVTGVPGRQSVYWGYKIGERMIPQLICSDESIQFVGWDEFSGPNYTGKHLTIDSELRHTSGVAWGGGYYAYFPEYKERQYINFYAKWRSDGLAKVGSEISNSINSNAIRFIKADEKPEEAVGLKDISYCNDGSLWTWYDGETQTQYWWSLTGKFRANSNSAGIFANKTNLVEIDFTDFDFSATTTLANAFVNSSAIKALNFVGADFSKVTTLAGAFSGCSSLESVDLGGIEFNSLTSMNKLFANCKSLTNVTMSGMVFPLVTDVGNMFVNCESLTDIDMSNVSFPILTSMNSMFNAATGVVNLNLSESNFSAVKSLTTTFANCEKLENLDITNTDFSSVMSLTSTFMNCSSLVELDLTMFNFDKLTNVHNMLADCTALETVKYNDSIDGGYNNLQYFDTNNPTYKMYYHCNANTPSTWLTGKWDENGTYINNLFYTITYVNIHDKYTVEGLPETYTKQIKWGYKLGRDELVYLVDPEGKYVFDGWYDIPYGYGDTKRIEISDERVVTGDVTLYARFRREPWIESGELIQADMAENFESGYTEFKQSMEEPSVGIDYMDISECEDGSVLLWGEGETIYWYSKYGKAMVNEDATAMFAGMLTLNTIDLTNLDFSEVTTMSSFFEDCAALKEVKFGDIDTSNVEDMSFLFERCTSLEAIDLTPLNTSRVGDMSRLFGGCISLKTVDITKIDTSNVWSMRGMFSECESLAQLDLSTFNTINVTDMSNMFNNCTSLWRLVLKFDTSNVENFSSMFYGDLKLRNINYGTKFVPDSGRNFAYMFMDAPCAKPDKVDWPNSWADDGTYLEY